MLYRVRGDSMTEASDWRDAFDGEALFLLAPGPSLRDANLDLLRQRGIVTMALNTAYITYRPTIWLGIDYPECYPRLVYQDPGVLKVSRASIAHIRWQGRQLCEYAAMFFLHLTPQSRPDSRPLFEVPARWYPKSPVLALQLAWWLGFKTVYTVGTEFRITPGRQYAHGNPLDRRLVNTNRGIYANTLEIIRMILPDLSERGLRVVNTTPASRLDFVPQMALSDAVAEVLAGKALAMDEPLIHSMAVKRRRRPRRPKLERSLIASVVRDLALPAAAVHAKRLQTRFLASSRPGV